MYKDEDKEVFQASALAALIGILAAGESHYLSAVNAACNVAHLMVQELKERRIDSGNDD